MPHYPYPQAVMDALAVMDQSPTGHAWAEYLRGSRVRVVFNDALGGPGGTVWFGWRIFFPTSMRTYLEPDRLAHELVHTTQGPYIFGSLEHERAAYGVQYRYLAETAPDDHARQFYLDIVHRLQAGGHPAYQWIIQQGPYYRHFPIHNPSLRQVSQWTPQIRYMLRVSRSRLKGGVQKG